MSYRGGVITGVLATLLLVGAAGAAWWFVSNGPPAAVKPTPPAPPATVAKPAKEDLFNTITLTAEAEQRLALKTATVERKPTRRVRAYGGEVVTPSGRTVVVSAPLSGTLKAPPGGTPSPGQTVKKGDPLFQLLPLLTPDGRANMVVARDTAEAELKNAGEMLSAAEVTLKQSKSTLASGTGRQRDVDEAEAQVGVRRKAVQVAEERRNQLVALIKQTEAGGTGPLRIDSPADGLLRNLSAAPGQTVPSGSVLFEVLDPTTVWVRVPVYVGDLPALDDRAPALVGPLAGTPGAAGRSAAPAAAPPSANVTAGTSDLFYELDNRETRYSPGQRVGVTVPVRGDADALTVPWAAVVHDLYGNTWVYERTAEHTYVRRRVAVRYVTGGVAVLADGPPAGTTIVTAGAAELFGTETGFSK